MLCQELLEVNNANQEDVHTSLMNSVVVLIIMKMFCQELLEVNYGQSRETFTLVLCTVWMVLIILKMLCQELLEGSKQCQSRRRSH